MACGWNDKRTKILERSRNLRCAGQGEMFASSTVVSTSISLNVVIGCAAPGTPSTPSPSNGATGVAMSLTLSWAACANTNSYDVYFGTSSTPPLVANRTTTNYAVSGLVSGTTYYWKIVAKNTCGGNTAGPVWNFTTIAETITAPNVPTGSATGSAGSWYTFQTGGSTSSLGHSVQYLFDWGMEPLLDGSLWAQKVLRSPGHYPGPIR